MRPTPLARPSPNPSQSSRRRVRSGAAIVLCWTLAAAPARAAVVVDYLYVESNEGNSSGGHVALRLDDRTYDFQHHDPGVLRLERREAGEFLYGYAFLQNRPVHVSRLAVSDETAELLRDRFNGIYLAEQAQFHALSVLAEDRRLLEAMADPDGAGATARIAVRGAGYFFDDGKTGEADSSPALVDLRARVEAHFGKRWLAARIDAEHEALANLEPRVVPTSDLAFGAGAYPRMHAAFSERYANGRTALAALEVLRIAAAVRADATIPSDDSAFDLPAPRAALLHESAMRLADDLVDLLSSRRADWGLAMLVGMARLDVLERSLRSGSLVVLDAYPSDTNTIAFADVRNSGALPALIADARTDAQQTTEPFWTASTPDKTDRLRATNRPVAFDESAWNNVEGALNRLHELLAVESDQKDLRIASHRLSPELTAWFPVDVVPRAESATFTEMATEAGVVERRYADALHERLAYNLTGRNCVSELLGTMDEAFGGNRAATTMHLGGWIDENSPARIVPFLSADAVNDYYRVASRHDLPSWREQRVATLASGERSAAAVALRESNTLTSRIYRRAPEDSFFVMFADNLVTRPLAGAVNLVAAAGATSVALVTLPLRGVEPLRAGLRGMLFSLPELAFQRIRKGSFVYVPREDAHQPDWW